MAKTRVGPGRPARRGRAPRRREARPEPTRRVALEDRYLLEDGRIFLSGVQALVRVPLDNHRADRARGLNTASLVSGYQGSPLGGLDRELAGISGICRDHHLVHVPAVNEELGATAAWGSQLAAALPGARYDGVVGVWYGKAPGLDRAADALRHANHAGAARAGGGLALVGDDPGCKSSTLPSASESLLASLGMPVFFPGDVQDVLDLGRHAIACSRVSGLWSAMKVVTGVADATGTAEVSPGRILPVVPREADEFRHAPNATFLPPASHELERSLVGPRTDLALAYARENDVNRIEGAQDAWLGVVAAGSCYHALRRALSDLGLGERALRRAGVRILRLGMISPLEPTVVREFARGLDEVLVVEEKGPFIESAVKELLYGTPDAPRVVGKRDETGAALLRAELDLDADRIALAVAARLGRRVSLDSVEARVRALTGREPGPLSLPMSTGPRRTPFFCSGCPHNSSTAAPDGALVGAGIGCHTMVLLNPEGRGDVTGVTQMGGEGAQWIGMAPFTDDSHFTQNLGDGTFFHSGSLAVRAAAAAGVSVTYKLLANGAVAMTGGQDVEGGMPVPDLTRLLELEGARRIIVTTDEPERYRGVRLADCAEVRSRAELMDAQRELAEVEGVTVLIHDQPCAAELRRARKRGRAPQPAERVHINERVCEGCGDCGRKSSCLSVQPVETEFGRKTRIHQSSCNFDRTCIEGDCPAFVTVVPEQREQRVPEPPSLPEPAGALPRSAAVRMTGVGGTGIVTVSQVLGMAALIDGRHVSGLDQTGLSQKGGPVVSDLRIGAAPLEGGGRLGRGSCDLLLALDLLAATTNENLEACSPGRTLAVVSTSAVPTGRMVIDPSERFPALDGQLDRIERVTRAGQNVMLDAQALSERLFGDAMQANLIAVGAAWQRGALPLTRAAIEEAIRLNGAAVERNLAAFAWGRAVVANPDAVAAATAPAHVPPAPLADWAQKLVEEAAGRAPERAELRRLLSVRVPELAAYGNRKLAAGYADAVRGAREAEDERAPGETGLAEAVARGLFKVTAYKDEYEVARLHLDSAERLRLAAEHGERARIRFHLHPPLLRALGLKRKLALGAWFVPALRLLRAGRRLRGTPFDPFGAARVRRTERALVREYRELVDWATHRLGPETHAAMCELCDLPDMVRGYEEIKLANVERYRSKVRELRAEIDAQPATPVPMGQATPVPPSPQ
jgi:indolepyruvate ferredoxin oxidoreductase